jgi:succinate dehydrogenase/fumarate reductase-like Fe-S protein
MNLDGKNGLACLTKVPRDGNAMKVSPLPHMFVVRDLVVDMSNFYAQYKSIKPYLQNDSVFQCDSRLLTSTLPAAALLVAPRHECASSEFMRCAIQECRAT